MSRPVTSLIGSRNNGSNLCIPLQFGAEKDLQIFKKKTPRIDMIDTKYASRPSGSGKKDQAKERFTNTLRRMLLFLS
ncbi:hypothetical protein M378DRAFT_167181 [Amanita muscaria Koide BX008]|uniref:Uncharacterized protein n=1 Tax=Amanita muscaria (strain Koide BX008) TaxID=946122 RepID=A0A0C2WI76_AMAMK|nr:hypothetical protein M378DRAFT_167181 [Amanita muscaria Koide BX008]